MTKIQKDATVNMQVTANGQRTQKPDFEFYSHDSETALINIKINTLEDATELSEEDTVRIFIRVKQKGQYKHLIYKMMKSEQRLQYQLYIPSELLGYVGRVECGVYIEFADGKTLDVGYFDFKMRKSMIDGEFKELDTIYVKEFSEALEKIKLIAEEYEDKYSTAIEENQEEFSEALEKIKLIAEEYEDKYSTAIEENQEEFSEELEKIKQIAKDYEENQEEFSEALEKIKQIAKDYEENQEEFSEELEKIKQIAKEYESKYSTAIEENQEEFNLFFNEAKSNMQALLESEGLVTTQVLKDSISAIHHVSTNLWAPLFYKDNVGYIGNDDLIVINDAYRYTDYIPTADFKKITRTVFAVPTTGTGMRYHFYDKDKKPISYTQPSAGLLGSVTTDIPDKTAFVRFYATPKYGSKIKVELGNKATDYSINPYDIETMFADIKKAVLELSDKVLGGK